MTGRERIFEEDRAAVRFLYWLVTGGEGDLPWGLRVFWKLLARSGTALLCYVLASQPGDTFMRVVVMCLAFCWFCMALFMRLGDD